MRFDAETYGGKGETEDPWHAPTAALSGSNSKAPGFAGGYLLPLVCREAQKWKRPRPGEVQPGQGASSSCVHARSRQFETPEWLWNKYFRVKPTVAIADEKESHCLCRYLVTHSMRLAFSAFFATPNPPRLPAVSPPWRVSDSCF